MHEYFNKLSLLIENYTPDSDLQKDNDFTEIFSVALLAFSESAKNVDQSPEEYIGSKMPTSADTIKEWAEGTSVAELESREIAVGYLETILIREQLGL